MTNKTTMEDFLSKLDFKLLKSQKTAIIKLQMSNDKQGSKFNDKDHDALEGVLALIDSLQDIAVDEYGHKETKVFRISRKEK